MVFSNSSGLRTVYWEAVPGFFLFLSFRFFAFLEMA